MPRLPAVARRLPFAVALLCACATHAPGGPAPSSADSANQARLEVVNRSSKDVDIYLERSGQRSRLGVAPAARTTRFSLGSAQVVGAGLLRFLAVPIGGSGAAAATEPVSVQTGQVLTLDVPPM